MNSISALSLTLLLAGVVPAQITETKPKPTATGETGQAKDTPAQDKEKPTPETQVVDTTRLLQNSLDVALKEQRFFRKIMAQGGLLHRFNANRKHNRSMALRFTPKLLGPTMPAKKVARLMGDEEKVALGANVIMTVESVPVTQKELDAMIQYLGSFPGRDAMEGVQTEAILALVRTKAAQGSFAAAAKKARAAIDGVAKQLNAGVSFSALAKKHSDDAATAEKGGKQGFVARSKTDKNFAQAAFSLNVGEVSAVVASSSGYHLIRLLGKKKGETADQDEVSTSHIFKRYAATDEIKALRARVAAGRIDVAFRSDELRKLAPAQFK